jgi:hypothetical protein
MRFRVAVLIALIGVAHPAAAQAPPDFRVSRASVAPRVDGDLSDAIWETTPPLSLTEWRSYSPMRGEAMPEFEHTELRVTHDDRYIYFAFHCVDSDPTRIRSTLHRRDDAFNDDWVGLSLDSTASGQSAYHLFVNPSGVQMDAVNTPAAGERFDNDLVWDSAGRRTPQGFDIEIAVPLQTIRFSGGQDVRMGIMFWRHFARSGVSYSSPDMPSGQWVFDRHAHLIFDELHERRLVELLPSATLPIAQTRAGPDSWNPADLTPGVGVSAKLGITSNVTLDTTINPDFSQVESDAFQVLVNQRFPVFFGEKRPFFMEGLGLFTLATTGGGNMRAAVHTRNIVDPFWGTKVTGTEGRLSFGFLAANDETPRDIGDRGDAVLGENKLFSLGRVTYAFGAGSNYLGAIVTDTEHAGRRNQASGGDVQIKLTSHQQLSALFLHTTTTVAGETDTSGNAAHALYSYNTDRVNVEGRAEHYDRDFQLDTGFYNRTGISTGFGIGQLNFHPAAAKRVGILQISGFTWANTGYDQVQGGYEGQWTTGVRFNTTRQGFFQVNHTEGYETWHGQRFDNGTTFNIFGVAQIYSWLFASAGYTTGYAPFYDQSTQGRTHSGSASITWQANAHFSEDVGYDWLLFDDAATGAHQFSVHIVNSKAIYQFDKHFLVRLLEQFDSSSHTVLTDLLASYEFVPGTVFFAGYGSVFERQGFDGNRFIPNQGDYLAVTRGLFFKASFLHRF